MSKGFYWHCHHDVLCEWVHDKKERVDYIKANKPKHEIKTRLKLFKKVEGKLPEEFIKAEEKAYRAWEAWKAEEKAAWLKARRAREAEEKVREAWEKALEVWEKYKPQIEKLHAKECGCKEWNGEEIVFENERNNYTRNKGHFLWKPMEYIEKFVKHHIRRNSDTPLKSEVQQ